MQWSVNYSAAPVLSFLRMVVALGLQNDNKLLIHRKIISPLIRMPLNFRARQRKVDPKDQMT